MTRVELLVRDVTEARPLYDALALRGMTTTVSMPASLSLDFTVRRRTDVVVNLLAAAGPGGEHDAAAERTRRLFLADALAWLADIGATVVNGLDAYVVGSSLARQVALFAHLGLPQPPARILGSLALVPRALEELGLAAEQAEIAEGPPVVVRGLPAGETVRLEFVGGRPASDPRGLPDTVVAAAAEVLGTAGMEFGGVTLRRAGQDVSWLGVDGGLGSDPAAAGALAAHVAFRAGLPA